MVIYSRLEKPFALSGKEWEVWKETKTQSQVRSIWSPWQEKRDRERPSPSDKWFMDHGKQSLAFPWSSREHPFMWQFGLTWLKEG